jgi:hypothetical protein
MTIGMAQWCSDAFSYDWYSVSPRDHPSGPEVGPQQPGGALDAGPNRVMRGRSIGYYTNYNDVSLWPIFTEWYYYICPAWTREMGAPLAAADDSLPPYFPPRLRGVRVVREVKAPDRE